LPDRVHPPLPSPIPLSEVSGWHAPEWLSTPRLAAWRIWDCLFVPAGLGEGGIERSIESLLPQLDRFSIERLCTYFPVGLETSLRRREESPDYAATIERCLQRWPDRLIGGIILNAAEPEQCLEHLDRWVRHGPMVAVLFPSSPLTLPCTHPNFDPIMRRGRELGVLMVQHTWFKSDGKGSAGESTPDELAELARRHPEVTFVCVHAGGEWEKGIRAIRNCPNVVIETSGFDPTAGFIEMAVAELGAERILFGRERSFATELAKVFGARITEEARRLILGGNLRRLLTGLAVRRGGASPAPDPAMAPARPATGRTSGRK